VSLRVRGNGGVSFGVQCRAGLGAERRGCARVRAGTPRMLWVLQAASRVRFSVVGVACTVGLGCVWFGELIRWVKVGLAAR
jgi:hypothetical protein